MLSSLLKLVFSLSGPKAQRNGLDIGQPYRKGRADEGCEKHQIDDRGSSSSDSISLSFSNRREVIKPGEDPNERLIFSYANYRMPKAAEISECIRKMKSDLIVVRFARYYREFISIEEGKVKIEGRQAGDDPNNQRVTSWLEENFPECFHRPVWLNGTLEGGDDMIAICGNQEMLHRMHSDFAEEFSSGDIEASFVVFDKEMAKQFDHKFLLGLQKEADVEFPGFWFGGWQDTWGSEDDQIDWIKDNVKGAWILYDHGNYHNRSFYFSDPDEALEFWFTVADRGASES